MRGLPDIHGGSGTRTAAALSTLLPQARFGRAKPVLAQLDTLLPGLENGPDPDTLLAGLHLRAVALRLLDAPVGDALAACDLLEQAAQQRRVHGWTATAWALRAAVRVHRGAIGEATAALAAAHDHLEPDHLEGDAGFALLDTLADTYHRLRLHDRAEETRHRLESTIGDRSPAQQVTHRTSWSQELAARAIEPLAGGDAEPDQTLLDHAVEQARQVAGHAGPGTEPARAAAGVRALAAAFRGHSAEAFGLLGEDAFRVPGDLAPVPTRLLTLAAMRAHAQVGSLATARSLDDAAAQLPHREAHLVLEVVRTRERLWLESYAGGDVVPVLDRMTKLLLRLGWNGMDLVADTARQALEHQALRAESRTDALTGVGNRRSMDEELRQLLRFSPLPTALVLIDIDDFKEINDRFSHVVGDQVLRRVAAALVTQLRSSDRLLRYGGDEFVALLPNTGDEEANRVAGRMAAAVADRSWAELADGLSVTITTGCAAVWTLTGRRPDADAERLFLRADEQLLLAKRRRRNGPERRSALALAPEPLSTELVPPELFSTEVLVGEVVHDDVVHEAADGPADHLAARAVAGPAARRGRRAAGPPDDGPLGDRPRGDGPLDHGPRDHGPRDHGPRDHGPRDDGPPDDGPPDDGQPPVRWAPPPTSSIPVPADRLPAVIDLARHERPRRADSRHRDVLEVQVDLSPSVAGPPVWEPPATEPAADPFDWPRGDPLTDPWVDHEGR